MTRLLALISVCSLVAGPAAAFTGFVFEDRNADGVRQGDELGVAGVVVTRGARFVETDAQGRYQLPDAGEPDGGDSSEGSLEFVVLTRPAGYDCERWYRVDPGDFALVPRSADGASFMFAHVSDAHISDRLADYAEFALPGAISALPRWLSGKATQLMLRFQNPDYSKRDVARAMRAAVSQHRDVSGWSRASVMGKWVRLLARMRDDDERPLIDPTGDFAASLAELSALAPRFVVSTGDLVLESNKADAASIDRWMRFYREKTRATGLRFYDTIGNNEIAGSDNDEFAPGDPGYGKALFRAHFGPTHYSFDRGGLHFIALDTHVLVRRHHEKWSFSALDEDVARWLEADLARNAGRPTVVLNHEPFGGDPRWSRAVRASALVDSEVTELLEQAGVRWTLAGHLHVNGLAESQTTQHITTGALSGMRWSFPPDAFARGYRLVQVRDGELYSVWKRTGEPVFGFVDPASDRSLHATAPQHTALSGPGGSRRVVVAAADVAGPFIALDIRLDDRLLPIERWSPYFAAAHYDASALAPGEHALVAEAQRADGSTLRIRLAVEGHQAVESER